MVLKAKKLYLRRSLSVLSVSSKATYSPTSHSETSNAGSTKIATNCSAINAE